MEKTPMHAIPDERKHLDEEIAFYNDEVLDEKIRASETEMNDPEFTGADNIKEYLKEPDADIDSLEFQELLDKALKTDLGMGYPLLDHYFQCAKVYSDLVPKEVFKKSLVKYLIMRLSRGDWGTVDELRGVFSVDLPKEQVMSSDFQEAAKMGIEVWVKTGRIGVGEKIKNLYHVPDSVFTAIIDKYNRQ